MNAPGMRLILDDVCKEDEPAPKRVCQDNPPYLRRLANWCPGCDGGGRKYKRRPAAPPSCRHCALPRAAHETRNDRSQMCPGLLGRYFEAAAVEVDPDPPCEHCAEPRSEHLSGLMQFERQLCAAENANALYHKRLQDEKARWGNVDGCTNGHVRF